MHTVQRRGLKSTPPPVQNNQIHYATQKPKQMISKSDIPDSDSIHCASISKINTYIDQLGSGQFPFVYIFIILLLRSKWTVM